MVTTNDKPYSKILIPIMLFFQNIVKSTPWIVPECKIERCTVASLIMSVDYKNFYPIIRMSDYRNLSICLKNMLSDVIESADIIFDIRKLVFKINIEIKRRVLNEKQSDGALSASMDGSYDSSREQEPDQNEVTSLTAEERQALKKILKNL